MCVCICTCVPTYRDGVSIEYESKVGEIERADCRLREGLQTGHPVLLEEDLLSW